MSDELYRERARLVTILAAVYPTMIGWADDEPGWWITYIQTPTGQLSWHLSAEDVDLFRPLESPSVVINNHNVGYHWDGHTTEWKYKRLEALAVQLHKQRWLDTRPTKD